MSTKNTIITKSIAGTLPIALLVVGLTLGLWTASARGHGGAAFAGRGPSFAPPMQEHDGAALTAREPSFSPAARAPAIANGRTATVPNSVNRRAALANIDSRLSRLDARFAAGRVGDDARRHHDRIRRTRDLLVGFVDLGTPDWEIGEWCDALWQDDIIAGMPANLVLDYWGNPIATESIVLDGAPAGVWTYHLRPGHTERITVANGVVRSVQQV